MGRIWAGLGPGVTSALCHTGWHRVPECAGNSSLAELEQFRDSQDYRLWLLQSQGEILGAWNIPKLCLWVGSTAVAGLGGTRG